MQLRLTAIALIAFSQITINPLDAAILNSDFSVHSLGILQGASVTWSDTNAILQSRTDLITGGWITLSNATSPYIEAPGLPKDFFRLDFGGAVNISPIAISDSYSVVHDQVLSALPRGVLGNDVDNNGLSLVATLVSSPSNGVLSFNPDGSFSYTPNAGFVGSDSFTYVASDELGGQSAPATVHISVINNAPVAQNDTYGVQFNQTLNVLPAGVLANDADADGDALTAILIAGPANGLVTLNSNGSFSYTPNSGFTGADSFTYHDNDGIANGNTAVVTLNVHSNNTPPVAASSIYALAEGAVLTVTAPGVLAPATDADGDPLSAELVTPPSTGTLSLNADGSFSYAPTSGFVGTDTFTFTAFDGYTNGNTATVIINVTNSLPHALPFTYYIHTGAILAVPPAGILAGDTSPIGDPLVAQMVSSPTLGTMVLNADGSFNYTNSIAGTDSFSYQAVDGYGSSTSAPAVVTIVATNRPPVAQPDNYGVQTNAPLNVAAPGVLANDTDLDGDALSAVLATPAANGSVSLNADGSFNYQPNIGFQGTDTFTYMAFDGLANSPATLVTITVHATNAPPVSSPSIYTIRPDETLTITNGDTVLDEDTDTDGDVLTATLLSNPANGTLSFNTNGDFVYVPNSGFVGVDSFTYQPVDGTMPGSATPVVINVVNSPPETSPDSFTFHFITTNDLSTNLSYTVNAPGVLEDATDPDEDELNADLVAGTVNGTLELNDDGSFTYSPNPGFVGIDMFTYVADDGYTTSVVTTVTLNITDTAPVAQAVNYSTTQNTTLTNPAPGVLENAYDSDGDPMTAVLVSPTSNGSLTLNPDGSFGYTPNNGFTGTDQFTYAATDGGLTSAPVAITITVTSLSLSARPFAGPQTTAFLSQLSFDDRDITRNLPGGATAAGRRVWSDNRVVPINAPENNVVPASPGCYSSTWPGLVGFPGGNNGKIGIAVAPGNASYPAILGGRIPYIYPRGATLRAQPQLTFPNGLPNVGGNLTLTITGDVYWDGNATLPVINNKNLGDNPTFNVPGGLLLGTLTGTAQTITPAQQGSSSFTLWKFGRYGWMSSSAAFPTTMGRFPMTIVWHATLTGPGATQNFHDNAGQPDTGDVVVGVSRHVIYLTYAQSLAVRDFWTTVDAGCNPNVVNGLLGINNLISLGAPALAALPLTKQLIIQYGGGVQAANVAVQTIYADAIFKNEFGRGATPSAPANTKRVDGAPLSFFGTSISVGRNVPGGYTVQATPAWARLVPVSGVPVTTPQDFEDLLLYGVGDRKAWADLYMNMLRSQGLANLDGSPMGVMTLVAASENGSGFMLRNGATSSALQRIPLPRKAKGNANPPTAYVNTAVFRDGNLPTAVNTPPWQYGFVMNNNDPNSFIPQQPPAPINGQNDAAGLAAGLGGAPNWWYSDYVVMVNPLNLNPGGLVGLTGTSLYSPTFAWGGLGKGIGNYQSDLVDGSFLYALRPPGRGQKPSFVIKPQDPSWANNECGVSERILTMSVPVPNPAAAFTVTVTATSTPGLAALKTSNDNGIPVTLFWQRTDVSGNFGKRGPTKTGPPPAATAAGTVIFSVPKLAKGVYRFTATAPGYANAVFVATQN